MAGSGQGSSGLVNAGTELEMSGLQLIDSHKQKGPAVLTFAGHLYWYASGEFADWVSVR